jgi:transposase
MSQRIRYVGLDVCKATISVAVAEPDGAVVRYGDIANTPGAVRRLVETLAHDAMVKTAYAAGPTGYPLHRQLTALGVENLVVAPSLIPRRPGDRIKTDQRDAIQLARLLRSGDLTSVWVPDEAHEALRDLVRARDNARTDSLRAKHRLSKFLLRHGVTAPARVGRAWSAKYQAWLSTVTFRDRTAQVTFRRLPRLRPSRHRTGAPSRYRAARVRRGHPACRGAARTPGAPRHRLPHRGDDRG